MINPRVILSQIVRNNPSISNNPIAMNYINVLQSGDTKKGEQIAQNLLNSYGMTKEQALQQAQQFFHFR